MRRQGQVCGVLAASSNMVKSWVGSGLKHRAWNLSPTSSPSLLDSDGYLTPNLLFAIEKGDFVTKNVSYPPLEVVDQKH